jgi:ZIP family zinc transporter
MLAIFLSVTTFLSTFIGGMFALRHKDKLHLIMGFAAGVLIGVVSFDVLPEILRLVQEKNSPFTGVTIALVAGFLLFHILEKMIVIHHSHESQYAEHKHPHIGVASALALVGHSFMDGVGIGLGFHVSTTAGFLVAFAVIAHDFTDGMNTVMLMLNHQNTPPKAKLFLLFDAVAPVLGAFSTLFFNISSGFLLLYLGFFAGFLLYIGASDILPEAHSKNSSWTTIFLTILGAGLIFAVTRLI